MTVLRLILQQEPLAAAHWLQAGVAGLFAIFTLYLSNIHAKERKERDDLWREFLKAESERRDELDGKWRMMLEAHQSQRKQLMETAYTNYFERIHEMAVSVERVAVALGSHDTNAQVRQIQVLAAIDKMREDLKVHES